MFKDTHNESDLTPIWITIYYDKTLQTIVGRAQERAMVNIGCPFGYVLHCVLTSYPEIKRRFPPGVLGFTCNGIPPDILRPMKDGDRIYFLVSASA